MQEKIMRQYFGSGPPPIEETDRNMSLVMVNNHWTMSYPRPLLPNFIELGNLHLKLEKNSLPKV
jgi:glucuronosyltransferase